MKFAYTILYVPDVVRAIEFYERAFGFQRGFVHESGEYGELQTGQTVVIISSIAAGETTVDAVQMRTV